MSFVASQGVTVFNAAVATTSVPIPKIVDLSSNGFNSLLFSHVAVDAALDANGTVNVSFDTTPSPHTVPITSVSGINREVLSIPAGANNVIISQSGSGAVMVNFGRDR